MRIAAATLIACGLALAGCSEGPANEAANVQEDAEAVATPTLVLTARGDGACTATWDGAPVTPDQLRDRSFAVLERAVAAAGGPARVREEQVPTPRIVAPPTQPWSCAAPWIDVVAASGFVRVELAETADELSPPFLLFAIPGMPPPPVPAPVLTVEAEGRFAWDGAAADAAGLRQRLGAVGNPPDEAPPAATPDPVPPPVMSAPAGVSLVPGPVATVGAMREALQILRDARVEANLESAPPVATVTPPGG